MSFNTGNTVPSSDSRDLSDNAENLDSAVNSQADAWQDRLGVTRDTVTGRLKKMGYTVPVAYAVSIVFGINDNVKTVDEGGIVYAPLPSALPFTTSGTFVGDDDARFFVIQGVTNDLLINDLSQAYEFDSATLMSASLIAFPTGKSLHVKDINTDYTVTVGASPSTDISPDLAGGGYALRVYSASKNIGYLSKLLKEFGTGAWAKALAYNKFIIDVDATKTGTYTLSTGQELCFDNATVSQSDNLTAFIANSKGWSLTGVGKITRAAGIPATQISGSIGFFVGTSSKEFTVSGGVTIEHFASQGWLVDGDDIIVAPVSNSSVSGLTCIANWDNFTFLDGFPAEYITYLGCNAIDSVNVNVLHEAGNINWIGGAITGGTEGGIHLRHPVAGGNPHHGMYVGVNINHNREFQIWADKIALGHDFIGCHIYNNGTVGTDTIKIEDSRGVNISNGTIGCGIDLIGTGHAHEGSNRISGNKMEGITALNTGIANYKRSMLAANSNFDIFGGWFYNDIANLLIRQDALADSATYTGSSSYLLTTAAFDTVTKNNREASIGATIIAPYDVSVEFEVNLLIELDAAIGAEYVYVAVADNLGGPFVEQYRLPLARYANSSGLNANVYFNCYSDVITKGYQIGLFLAGTGAGKSIVIGAGSYFTVKTNG